MSNLKSHKNQPKIIDGKIDPITEMTEERFKKTQQLLGIPSLDDIICSAVANGGSLVELCNKWDVRYSDIMKWIREDQAREAAYNNALKDRDEWFVSSLIQELRYISMSNITQLFDENGVMLPLDQWPAGAARAVEAVKVDELFDGDGKNRRQIGYTKQVKMWNKTKAIELLGRYLKMFLDRVEVSGNLTLEELVLGANNQSQTHNENTE